MRQAVRCARLHWVHSHMGGEASLQFWSAEMHFDLVERSARTGMERIVWHLCKPKEWQSVKGKAATFLSKRKKSPLVKGLNYIGKESSEMSSSLVRQHSTALIGQRSPTPRLTGLSSKTKSCCFFFFKWSVLVKRSISLRVSLLIGME